MFTETELREAMQHSAVRADQRIDAEQHGSTDGQPSRAMDNHVPLVHPTVVRRRTWLPLAAAAAAVAVAGGAVVLTAKSGHHSSGPAQHNSAAATGSTSAHKPKPAVAKLGAAVALTNLVTIPGNSGYELQNGTESITPPSGGMQVMAFPAGRFDATKRLTGARPIFVAGRPGYAGQALIYLIDPNDKEQAKKAGAPRNTIAWPAGDGSWLVLQGFMADEPDLSVSTLVHDAEQFGAKATPAPLHSGYRAGWLPAGMTLTGVDGSVGNPAVSLTLTAGRKSINIQLSSVGMDVHPTGGSGLTVASGKTAGYTATVTGTGYDQATVQHVLDGLDFSRLHGAQSGWWTLAQAVDGS